MDVVRVGGTTLADILLGSCSSGRSGSVFVIVYRLGALDATAEMDRLAVDAMEELELVTVGLRVVESFG